MDKSVSGTAAATELEEILSEFQKLFIPWIKGIDYPESKVLEHHEPEELAEILQLELPEETPGKAAILTILTNTLKYSANTWHQGFMDKLFASTNPIGVISELLLAILNTNAHVYHVSPVLTLMERKTSSGLAHLFGFHGEHAGGLTLPGGSQSNTLSIVTARNILYPETKENGNGRHKFVIFTSEHGHYSVEKAAILCGLGRSSVWTVSVDSLGRMKPEDLAEKIRRAQEQHYTPFYVNATAGTTVYGSFDPLEQISRLCMANNLWLHVDGSWGGAVCFSNKRKHLIRGSHLADSITFNPHKMLGVPLQCSFLLAPDSRIFKRANSLNAAYLFHEDNEGFDIGDSTMGCGRRPDGVKMFLGWNWYGRKGYEKRVEHAYQMAAILAEQIEQNSNFTLVSSNPPPCLQVCFYFNPNGVALQDAAQNTKNTRCIAAALDREGQFLVDFAPGPIGEFFRAVPNSPIQSSSTMNNLCESIQRLGNRFATGRHDANRSKIIDKGEHRETQ